MTSVANEKIIERIKNLLALGTNDGATEAERALAMDRARRMMAQYCVTLCDLDSETKLDIVAEEWKPSDLFPLSSTLVKWLPGIIGPIAKFFGGFSTFSSKTGKVWIYGYEPNIKIIQYATNAVLLQGYRAWQKEFRQTRTMSFSDGFWHGFAQGIQLKFKKPHTDGAQSGELTIYDAVEARKREFSGVSINSFASADSRKAGRATGENVTVHKGMDGGASQKGNLLQ